MQRFLEHLEVVSAASGVAQQIERAGLAGEEEDAAILAGAAQGDGQLDASHARDHDVGDENVGRTAESAHQRLAGIVEGMGVESVFVQDGCERFGDDPLIVDNVYARTSRFDSGLRHRRTPSSECEIGKADKDSEMVGPLFLFFGYLLMGRAIAAMWQPGRWVASEILQIRGTDGGACAEAPGELFCRSLLLSLSITSLSACF
jgi:hypothetical protein